MIDKPSEGLDKRFLLFYFCITDIKNGNNNKNKLTMKTKLITLTVLLLSAFAMKAQEGEIIFVDFEPDSLVQLMDIDLYPESRMNIDFDFDNLPDIRINQRTTSTGFWFQMKSYEPEWEIHEYEAGDTLVPMNEPDQWWSTGITWLPYFYHDIDTMSDRFAVRHKVGDDYFYGWFRTYITPIPNQYSWPWVALDQMAYCTIPNYPLVWGQTIIVGIVETIENGFSVYPNPANNILFVETRHGTSLPDQTYRITNLMGQTLLQGPINAENQQINIASLPAGMYFISVGDMIQKFVVK
jgi:hypothetical protein